MNQCMYVCIYIYTCSLQSYDLYPPFSHVPRDVRRSSQLGVFGLRCFGQVLCKHHGTDTIPDHQQQAAVWLEDLLAAIQAEMPVLSERLFHVLQAEVARWSGVQWWSLGMLIL